MKSIIKSILLISVIFISTVCSCTKMSKNEVNTPGCIMDTLKGEWSWIKTSTAKHGMKENDFKSIIKVLSQNEDTSVNYELIVDDELYYNGNFQIQCHPYLFERTFNIKLPHWIPSLINEELWVIYFGDRKTGMPSKDILCLWSGADDDNLYYYQKIK